MQIKFPFSWIVTVVRFPRFVYQLSSDYNQNRSTCARTIKAPAILINCNYNCVHQYKAHGSRISFSVLCKHATRNPFTKNAQLPKRVNSIQINIHPLSSSSHSTQNLYILGKYLFPQWSFPLALIQLSI